MAPCNWTPAKDVAATLVEHGINAAPVIDASDRLVGIVSEADLLAGGPARPRLGGQLGSATAREVMSQSVYTLTEHADAAAAARMMLRHNLKSVPVVTGDRVVGIARRDLLRLIARSDDDIRAELEGRLKEGLDALQRLTVASTAASSPSMPLSARSAGDCSRGWPAWYPAWSRCAQAKQPKMTGGERGRGQGATARTSDRPGSALARHDRAAAV